MLRLFFFSSLYLFPVSVPAFPEFPGLSGSLSTAPSTPSTEKTLDEQLQDAKRGIDEAQSTLTYMQSEKISGALSAAGLPSTLRLDLVTAAGNVLRNAQRYLENLETLHHTQKNAEARQFLVKLGTEPGSSSADVELARERFYATQQALEAAQSEMKFLLDRTQQSVSHLSKLDQAIRQLSLRSGGNNNWKQELVKLQKKGVELLILADLARKNTLTLRIGALRQEAIADKKLIQADVTAIRPQQGKEALSQLEKERIDINHCIQEAHKRDQPAQAALNKARESYLRIRSDRAASSREVTSARQQYELAQVEIETVEEIIEDGRSYLHILDTETAYWKSLTKLGDRISTTDAQREASALKPKLELIQKWKPHLEQEVRSKQLTIEGIKRHIDERRLKDSDREFFTKKLRLFQEQNEMQQRLLWRVETLQWRLSDGLRQLQQMAPPLPLPTGFKEIWGALYATVAGTFNYEVLHSKETKMVGGTQVVIEEHSVTVGHIITALVLFLLGYSLLGKVAHSSVRAAQIRFQLPAARIALLEKLVLYPMILLLALCVLSWVRIPLTVFAYLGGALAIGVGFGAQNLINNFISGIILLFERQVNVGDIVEVDTHTGAITALGSRCSRMRRGDGVEVLIPNSLLLEKNVVNWTLTEPNHRFSFTFTVAYGASIERVMQLVTQALNETPYLLKQPPHCVFFEQFGSDGLIFGVYYWVKLGIEVDPRQPGSDLRFRIDQLFRIEGIHMPFAQRDIHLDSASPVHVHIENEPQNRNPA
ncbi:MAG: mechanosensitive ion channel [Candidatus Xiphinematobacter sp.]|nr:MAG: mechanosensitive ion channel [Candidatus Xiphinematobacter sp.]